METSIRPDETENGRFKFLQSECKIFLHESSRQANMAENSPFQCGTFQLHQSPNGTMAHSFISALPIGKCRWNLSSIYHFPNSNSVLFYVNTCDETELQPNLDENLTSLWSLLNKNCRFLVIKLLLNIPFLFILIF